jgi:hypothetical protein
MLLPLICDSHLLGCALVTLSLTMGPIDQRYESKGPGTLVQALIEGVKLRPGQPPRISASARQGGARPRDRQLHMCSAKANAVITPCVGDLGLSALIPPMGALSTSRLGGG